MPIDWSQWKKTLRDRVADLGPRRWPAAVPGRSRGRVGVVTVSYNTIELTAMLIFSLYRVLERGAFDKLLVVDNGSEDGSLPLLRELERHGLLELVANREQLYHGPALNQAIEHLAAQGQNDPGEVLDALWIVDSDIVVLRPDALRTPLARLRQTAAAMVGEETGSSGRLELFTLLLDPRRVWRRGIPRFREHGLPSDKMQAVLRRRRVPTVPFSYIGERYVFHVGSGTMWNLLERGLTENRYYHWAKPWQGFLGYDLRREDESYLRFLAHYRRELPVLETAALVGACKRSERVTLALGP